MLLLMFTVVVENPLWLKELEELVVLDETVESDGSEAVVVTVDSTEVDVSEGVEMSLEYDVAA